MNYENKKGIFLTEEKQQTKHCKLETCRICINDYLARQIKINTYV